jgi:hypothetical protein
MKSVTKLQFLRQLLSEPLAALRKFERWQSWEERIDHWIDNSAKIDAWFEIEKKIDVWRDNSAKIEAWFRIEEKIKLWNENAQKIETWMASENIIASVLEVHKQKYISFDFENEYQLFRKLSEEVGRSLALNRKDLYPCLYDRSPSTPFDRHYTYFPAWAARVLARTQPPRHVDISSTLNFASILSAFVPVDFYDIRPAALRLTNLCAGTADLLSLNFPNETISSLSCMHVIEHVGLGRYGDDLSPNGDIKRMFPPFFLDS